jgi:hypothetical protein
MSPRQQQDVMARFLKWNRLAARAHRAAWPPTPEAFIKEIAELRSTLMKMVNSVPFRSPAVLKAFHDLRRTFTKMEAAMEKELKVIEDLEAVGGLRSASRVARRHLQGSGPLSLRPDYGTGNAALPRGEDDELVQKVANGWLQARADAADRYKANVKDVRAILKKIDGHVSKHEREAKSNPQDWGYAGDMDHVKTLLTEVDRFLSNYR